MVRTVISLRDLLEENSEKDIHTLWSTFESRNKSEEEQNEVATFLKNKAIDFERADLSTTHIVFDLEDDKAYMLGYFSLAMKPLHITKRNFDKLSKNQKKKLKLNGRTSDHEGYNLSSCLIGQLGKNCSETTKGKISGEELLTIAYKMLLDVKKMVGCRYVWLECEDEPKLLKFYTDFGFNVLSNFKSSNGLNVLIMRLEEK